MEPDPDSWASFLKSPHDTIRPDAACMAGEFDGHQTAASDRSGGTGLPGFIGGRYAAALKNHPPMTGQVPEATHPANHPPEGPSVRGGCVRPKQRGDSPFDK